MSTTFYSRRPAAAYNEPTSLSRDADNIARDKRRYQASQRGSSRLGADDPRPQMMRRKGYAIVADEDFDKLMDREDRARPRGSGVRAGGGFSGYPMRKPRDYRDAMGNLMTGERQLFEELEEGKYSDRKTGNNRGSVGKRGPSESERQSKRGRLLGQFVDENEDDDDDYDEEEGEMDLLEGNYDEEGGEDEVQDMRKTVARGSARGSGGGGGGARAQRGGASGQQRAGGKFTPGSQAAREAGRKGGQARQGQQRQRHSRDGDEEGFEDEDDVEEMDEEGEENEDENEGDEDVGGGRSHGKFTRGSQAAREAGRKGAMARRGQGGQGGQGGGRGSGGGGGGGGYQSGRSHGKFTSGSQAAREAGRKGAQQRGNRRASYDEEEDEE